MVCASGEVFIPFCNLISVPLPRMGRVYPIQFCLIGDEDCALVLKKHKTEMEPSGAHLLVSTAIWYFIFEF
jgi:hypothetical protein